MAYNKITPKERQLRYRCEKCDGCFEYEELASVEQWDGEGVMGGWHSMEDKCPHCGCLDLEEVYACIDCGKCFYEEDLIEEDDGYLYCEECAKKYL